MIDVDGHNFPNLALMKLSAWHKKQGDQVEVYFPMNFYDRVYMSKIFDFTPDFEIIINADEIIRGGIGYPDEDKPLEYEIFHTMPDYSLYGITDTAYGFLTRGCPRNCSFCNVSQHQGNKSVKVSDLSDFWNGQKFIKLLDPSITACRDWRNLFQQLIDSKARVDFTQGIDIRTMTIEKAEYLNRTRWDMLHFSWDNYEMKTYEQLKRCRPYFKVDGRKLVVYVLVNYNTTFEQDLERIYELRMLDYSPYVMIYNKGEFIDQRTKRLKKMSELLKRFTPKQIEHFKNCMKMQRWTCNRYIWQSCKTFTEYKFYTETKARRGE